MCGHFDLVMGTAIEFIRNICTLLVVVIIPFPPARHIAELEWCPKCHINRISAFFVSILFDHIKANVGGAACVHYCLGGKYIIMVC